MTNKRGNQSSFDLDASDEIETLGDLYNPGHADFGRSQRADFVSLEGDQDISESARVTLGNYLSSATRGRVGVGRPNVFQVPAAKEGSDPPASEIDINASSLVAPFVAANQLRTDGQTEGTFLDVAKGNDPIAGLKFEMTSVGDHGSLVNPFQLIKGVAGLAVGAVSSLSKIPGSPDLPAEQIGNFIRGSGHDRLLNIKPAGNATTAELGNPATGFRPESILQATNLTQPAISSILTNNRFSQIERAFVQNHERTGTGIVIQPLMGSNTKSGGRELTDTELSDISSQILSRAAGKTDSSSSPDLRATGQASIPAEELRAGSTVPGAASKFSASEYVNSDLNILSYGSIYTPGSSYEGGSDLTYAYDIVATAINHIIAFVDRVKDLIKESDESEGGLTRQTYSVAVTSLVQRLRDGRVRAPTGVSKSMIALGIPDTVKLKQGWYSCFLQGLSIFFGTSFETRQSGLTTASRQESAPTNLDLNNLPEDFRSTVSSSPGYYVAIARNALRDSVIGANSTVESSASDSGGTESSRNKYTISEIYNSRSWKFVLAIISLGYQSLERSESLNESSDSDTKSMLTVHDSRDRVDGGKIPWRHAINGRSSYVLPASLVSAASLYRDSHAARDTSENPRSASGQIGIDNPVGIITNSRKISQEEVKRVEDVLEGEYMPFYFQDLRTNEIMSFHAFLTDLSDGFTATYNSVSGYGRADDVMVYNNTKRSINFGFTLVATSPEDHDALYWDVNKIVSLLYPQYSRGRSMINDNQRFIQPFSQIPTSSPMVRVRIGDVIKSNYSKFGLARLFGLGQDAFSVQTTDQVSAEAVAERQRRDNNLIKSDIRLAAAMRDLYVLGPNPGEEVVWLGQTVLSDFINSNSESVLDARGRLIADSGFSTAALTALTRSGRNAATVVVSRARVESVNETVSPEATLPLAVSVRLKVLELQVSQQPRRGRGASSSSSVTLTAEDLGNFHYIDVDLLLEQETETSEPSGEEDEQNDFSSRQSGRLIRYTDRQLSIFRARFRQEVDQANQAPEREGVNSPEAIGEFFSSSVNGGNPIVRSFESTRGRGLAGFITDLKLDWGESTWGIDPGLRAPIMIKLNVTFSPIHDIPMGLDSDGAMRSVAYGVGRRSTSIGGDPYDI